jgi:hypothetical protein
MYSKSLQAVINNANAGKVPEFEFDFNAQLNSSNYPYELLTQNESHLDSIFPNVYRYYRAKGVKGIDMYEIFKKYLITMYEKNKGPQNPNYQYVNEANEINLMTGIPLKNIDLKKAFAAPNLYAFYHILFFNNSTEFIPMASRDNLGHILVDNDYSKTKNSIYKILLTGKPALVSIYLTPNDTDKSPHAALIVGYKKLKNPGTGELVDAFKLHNNWGEQYAYESNEEWFLADNIVSQIYGNIYCIYGLKALSKDWIENTPDYKRIFKNTYSDNFVKYHERPVGVTVGTNQKDAAPLYNMVIKSGYDYRAAANLYKDYFIGLGYKFKREDVKARELFFDGVEIWLSNSETHIVCPDAAALEKLMSKMDFSTIKGKFIQGRFSDGGDYIKTDQYK